MSEIKEKPKPKDPAVQCRTLISFSSSLYNRHYQYEQKLARLLWKVDFKDIHTDLKPESGGSPYNNNERVRHLF